MLVARLSGQADADRRGLVDFRESISAETDTASLARLAEQYEAVETGDAREALARLRAAFTRLQAGKPAQAEKDFARAARLEPTWPVPWLGLGEAHTALGLITRHNTQNLGTQPGLGEFRAAAEAYATSLRLDPRFTPAIEGELRLAAERRDTALLVTAIAHAHQLPPDAATPAFLLALSRAEWRMGDVAAALATLEAVPESATTPSIRYERGRSALAMGDPLGEVDYWGAVPADDPEMLLMLHRDMSLIATPSELKAFDASSGQDRVAFLHQFWDRRGAISLRSPGERLREHYRRIAYADRHFAFSEVRHMQKPDDLHSSFPFDSMLDSRGVVYVRMGPPDARVQPQVCGYVANETWGYHRADDELLLHFASQNSIGDYLLVRSVQDINGESVRPRPRWDPMVDSVEILPAGYGEAVMAQIGASRTNPACGADLYEMMRQRQGVSPIYGKLLNVGRVTGPVYLQQLAVLGRQSIKTSTTTDAQPLRFPVSVTSQVLPLAIGTATGGSGVHIAVALVQLMHEAPGRRDTLRLRFAAFDQSGNAVTKFDSTVVYAPPSMHASGDSSYTAFGHFATTLPAGTWKWTAAIQSGDSSGALLASQLITIPVHDASTLAVSDLAIGARGQAAPWLVAPGDTAWLTPRHGFQARTAVVLYYEVYGIPAGQAYHAEVTARRGDKATGPGISLGFEEKSTGTPTRVSRTLSLESLTPGDYVLEVQIRDAKGTIASSSRPLKVVKE